MTLLLLASLLLQDTWEYSHSQNGFVNSRTRDLKTPDELFALGESMFGAGDPEGASAIFRTIADTLPGDDDARERLRQKSHFAVGRCSFARGDYARAHAEFDGFLVRFPDSALAGGVYGARYYLFLSALTLARVGTQESLLGLPLYTTAKPGIALLRQDLLRYPVEPFTDDFYLALGDLLVEQGDVEEALLEYRQILQPGRYERTNSAPRAQLRVAKIEISRFDGVWYDVKMLAAARREYDKFLSSWSAAKDDPRILRELDLTAEELQGMLDEAAAGIAAVEEKLAEKEWTMAGFYLDRGRPRSAVVYARYILANYPRTSWAEKARQLVESVDARR